MPEMKLPTDDEMMAVVRAHPEFLYTYSPLDTGADCRYVFQGVTMFSLRDAYIHAMT